MNQHHINQHHFGLEFLEARYLLAGDLVFADPITYRIGSELPGEVTTADVNGDQIPDVIVTSESGPSRLGVASIFIGNGDGSFQDRKREARSADSIATADFDGNGSIDMATANGSSAFVALNEGLKNDEWSGYDNPIRFSLRLATPAPAQDVSTGDFDGDGYVDLAVGHPSSVPVLLNLGVADGQWQGFGKQVDYLAGEFPSRVTNGLIDNDGDLDLVVANYFGGSVSVLIGNGDGTFVEHVEYKLESRAAKPVIADFDHDGDNDIVASGFNSRRVYLLRNNGDGSFADPESHRVARSIFGIRSGDLDGDGDQDLVMLPWSGTRLPILINNGDGSFVEEEYQLGRISGVIRALEISDIDVDGIDDFVFATGFRSPGNLLIVKNMTEPQRELPPGDSNGDGIFNQLDIVQILQAGKYLTGESATFEEGDWNGDGVFDQLDIVEALKSGDYSPGR